MIYAHAQLLPLRQASPEEGVTVAAIVAEARLVASPSPSRHHREPLRDGQALAGTVESGRALKSPAGITARCRAEDDDPKGVAAAGRLGVSRTVRIVWPEPHREQPEGKLMRREQEDDARHMAGSGREVREREEVIFRI